MPIETVRESVPDLYLEYLAEIVMDGYARADKMCRENFQTKHARGNAMPWNRRSFIEEAMLQVPEALAEEVTIAEVRNSWWWHAEITIGPVVIAQATASDADAKIRVSSHKSLLASQTQLRLFPVDGEIDNTKRLFAALTHGPIQSDPSRPAFVEIQVPKLGEDGEIVGYYPGKIDLMEEFPNVFTPIDRTDVEEQIEDAAFPEPLAEQDTGE
jgi:hypothetical protein